jgi:uncharacterized protein (DUF58 family)
MILTKRFWALVALGIPIAAFSGAAGTLWPLIGFNALVLLAAVLTYRMGPDHRGLRLRRTFDPVLSVRVSNKIELSLINDGAEALVGRLRDEPPPRFSATRKEFDLSLKPGDEVRLRYEVTPGERGSDYFRGSYLRLDCPLGLVQRQVKLPTEQPVRVYPNVLALREFDLLNQRGKLSELGIRRARMRGLGTDFESLREYSEGDDFRKIDWKATARRGKLVVRQYEQERNQPVIICIDIGRKMLADVDGVEKLDHTLDCCLMLAQAASLAGDLVGLLVYADTVRRYIPPRKGRNQIGAIIEAIHDLVGEPVESDSAGAFAYLASRWKRRSLVVVFTDVDHPDAAQAAAAYMSSLRRHHLAVLVRIADPRLQELVTASVKDADALYSKSAALMFTEERAKAEAILASRGIDTLEAEPQDLARALVSYYFYVKEHSLL